MCVCSSKEMCCCHYKLAVVPQAADFTCNLFTQKIGAKVTFGQHGLSDLNKRYFQLAWATAKWFVLEGS